MSKYNLISHHLCPYVQRAVIILIEKNVEHKKRYIDLANKPDWFVAISPLGRVPILETDGVTLFESQVIVEYLDEVTFGSIHPKNALEKARHRSWIEFGSETLKLISVLYQAVDVIEYEKACLALKSKFTIIENEIAGPFFDGKDFRMIDGVWGTIFRYFDVFDRHMTLGIMDGLPRVELWRKTISQRPSVINAIPKDYSERLELFLKNKSSHISKLIQ